jgi:hypothetical protein
MIVFPESGICVRVVLLGTLVIAHKLRIHVGALELVCESAERSWNIGAVSADLTWLLSYLLALGRMFASPKARWFGEQGGERN